MPKINKYKQNNHNGRNANRRRRLARITFKARATIQILTISNVSSDLLEAIDELAARQDRSRSSFVRRELERIVVGYRAKVA
jgi:Ribbon-helix-helix protein, copG family